MLAQSKAFSGFAVDDLEQARDFYGETLGLEVELIDDPGLLNINLAGGRADPRLPQRSTSSPPPTRSSTSRSTTSARPSTTSPPAAWPSSATTAWSRTRTASPTARPEIAWFKDPAGNILAVLESES